jgi:putative spermidine/putrescine transport system ATP-binding protein
LTGPAPDHHHGDFAKGMSFIDIANLRKVFGTHPVVHDFSLSIDRGEFVSFLGPSGCGKTTVLRMIAGFETATSGAIRIDGADVTHLPPARRKVGMVFQAYALFPNMTVAGNIAFGLKVADASSADTKARVGEMLELIKLPHLADRYPYQLSGGQQQRVALARALAVRPQVLLLDEPLSALDAKIRISLREDIRQLQRQLGITTVFVTHDQEEAMSISDRIVVMNEGRAEQVGAPPDIYNTPRTRFVASFVGTLNIVSATVVDGAAGTLDLEGQSVTTGAPVAAAAGTKVTVALRPEAVTFDDPSAGDGRNRLAATVEEVSFLGSIVRVRLRVGGTTLSMDTFNNPGAVLPARGETVTLGFDRKDLIVLD